jgi:tetratricopeptide (TPR) repeat protein
LAKIINTTYNNSLSWGLILSRTDRAPLEDMKSETLAESGQIPCLLVYPDQRHVRYVHQITNCIEELLHELGFSVKKISEATLPDHHFGEKFENLAEKCVLGIVIFDGFRPNVIFEYGYLRGKGKIVLPIKDESATIAVKSLYALSESADEHEIKNLTGLTEMQFSRLKEPSIGYFNQLSDRHGINMITVDCNAALSSKKHPKVKIKAEIDKLMPKILKLYAKQSLETVNKVNPELFKRFENITLQLLQYFTKITPFDSADIKNAIIDIENLERESGVNVPSTVYITASSLYQILAHRTTFSEVNSAVKYYGDAIRILLKILHIERDPTTRATIQENLGNTYVDLSEVRDAEENLRKAIKAYQEALTIYTKENYPLDYAMTQNNLGIAYGRLSEVRDAEENSKKAIKAFEEALTIRTKENYPLNYATTQMNLGNAYRRLSEVKDREENSKKAIKAFEEALTIRTKENYPLNYATTQMNLGNAYRRLSEVKDREENSKKAIKAFEEALTIYTKKNYPIQHGYIQKALTHLRFSNQR